MKKLESGRSMVEMLGVLAIIGVLSVGGIAGYTLSMRRHRANGVADTAAKLALVAYSACQNEILNSGSDNADASVCSSATKSMTPATAGLGGTPNGVTEMKVTGITAGGTANADKVTIDVTFNDDKLCNAFGSIVGGTNTCSSDNKVSFSITQN